MGKAGFLLTTLGFLAGAFLASLDPRIINWAAYLPAIAVGAVGVWLLKRDSMAHARSDETLASNRANIEESLNRIVANLEELESGKEGIPPWELRFEIDHRFREDLNAFVEARESLSHIYGLQAYADIMSDFAAGERYLNRVWSASADGYVQEAKDYIHRALIQFQHARRKLDAAHAAHAPQPAG
jgi:hypothetical protein